MPDAEDFSGEEDDYTSSPAVKEKDVAKKELFDAMIKYFKKAKAAELGEKDQAGELDSLLVEAGKFWDVIIPDDNPDEMIWG